MIRAVLAVVLTTALLGASLPAIDDGRREHTHATVERELDRFERVARALRSTDDPVTGSGGARRLVTLSIPERSWSDAGLDVLTIAAWRNGSGGVITWRRPQGPRQDRRLPGLPLRTAGDGPLRLATDGDHRLVLSLDGTPRNPVVTVRRFTTEDVTTPDHARATPRTG